jgi:cadmium resistance protein CadD (predicted permease)
VWQTLKLKVVDLVCIVAMIVVLVLALPAAPLGLLFWLISVIGAVIERFGSWLLDLVYVYLERLQAILNRIDDVTTENENQAKSGLGTRNLRS